MFDKLMDDDFEGDDVASGFDKILTEVEDEQVRLGRRIDNSSMSNSTLSGDNQSTLKKSAPSSGAKHDRFIPQRNRANATLNFETKELLFAKK